MSKKLIHSLVVAAIVMPFTLAIARQPPPATNVGRRHPNLDAAQNFAVKAYDKLTEAQKANEYDLGGHAAKAKEALRVAADEIKLAAESANKN